MTGSSHGCLHCWYPKRYRCSTALITAHVLVSLSPLLMLASSTATYSPFASCSRGQPCPEYHYCSSSQRLCLPCSTCGNNSQRCQAASGCSKYGLTSNVLYGMTDGAPEFTPSCNAAHLDADSMMASCKGSCDRRGPAGSLRCFTGALCTATCVATETKHSRAWSGECACRFTLQSAECGWSHPVPSCPAVEVATSPVDEKVMTTCSSAPVSHTSAALVSALLSVAASSSSRTYDVCGVTCATVVCITAVVGLVAVSVIVWYYKKKPKARLGDSSANEARSRKSLNVNHTMSQDHHQGRVRSDASPAATIVNNVTNNVNIAVQDALGHLVVNCGAAASPELLAPTWASLSTIAPATASGGAGNESRMQQDAEESTDEEGNSEDATSALLPPGCGAAGSLHAHEPRQGCSRGGVTQHGDDARHSQAVAACAVADTPFDSSQLHRPSRMSLDLFDFSQDDPERWLRYVLNGEDTVLRESTGILPSDSADPGDYRDAEPASSCEIVRDDNVCSLRATDRTPKLSQISVKAGSVKRCELRSTKDVAESATNPTAATVASKWCSNVCLELGDVETLRVMTSTA